VAKSPIRILVVEDFEPFRAFVTSSLEQHPEFEIIGELSDGLEAVGRAAELNPDLVLLDVGLPSLNGIAAARRIREHSPQSKILFISGDQASDIVEQALSTGAAGYLVKSDAGRELLVAVAAVLQGKQYLCSSLSRLHLNHNGHHHPDPHALSKSKQGVSPSPQGEIAGRHEVVFYSNDSQLLDHLAQFIAASLNAGNGAVVIATGAHRENLARSLEAGGVDVAELLSTCMVNDTIDSNSFLEGFGQLISQAANAAKTEHPRVAVFGEGPDLLWKQSNVKAAIQDEKLGSQLAKTYAVDILCGYSLNNIRGMASIEVLQQICAEHTDLCCR
jgi:DNA-binding NarL/FixJ family response regulator